MSRGTETPVCDFIRAYRDRGGLRLHMPGHKGLGEIEALDLTEIQGLDPLYPAAGPVRESEDIAAELFGAFTEVAECERKKGFPDVYLLACERLGSEVHDTVVFEDILTAVQGAKAGGFFTVGVYDETSARDTEQIRQCADAFITGFEELIQGE